MGIGVRQFGVCIAYFVVSSLWTRWVVPSEGALKGKVVELEAEWLRHGGRLVEWVEEIHFADGARAEVSMMDSAYCSLYQALSALSAYDWVCGVARNYMVRYLGVLASFIALLPRVAAESEPTEFLLNNLHD